MDVALLDESTFALGGAGADLAMLPVCLTAFHLGTAYPKVDETASSRKTVGRLTAYPLTGVQVCLY